MNLTETIKANVLSIRAQAAAFMTDTCVIRRKTGNTVVHGENRPVYDAGEDSVCRLIVRSGSESINIASQERLIAQSQFTGLYRMQLPFGTNIDIDDHIEYTDKVTSAVRTFEVIFVPPFHEMMGAFVIAIREVV